MTADASEEPCLDKARHVKYWKRCLKTLLPHHYTGNESNRMYLAFFIISALDLLDAWSSTVTEDERKGYTDWVYHCQHPNGGFRMWPGTDFGSFANHENSRWDPANIPATYFALSILLVIGDDMKRVKRKETLQWLHLMQRPDGSFGETLVDGRIEGGKDPRFGYCATGIRYMLRGDGQGSIAIDDFEVRDIQIDALVRCVKAAEAFDGGIADEAFHEPHAGYTFCSLGCLKFINRLNTCNKRSQAQVAGPSRPAVTLSWLIHRQTDVLDPDAELPDEGGPNETTSSSSLEEAAMEIPLHQSPDKSVQFTPFAIQPCEAGMNGRTNKVADTCYAWWVAGSFSMLEQPDLYHHSALRAYLLESTQHPALGGFGKFPGDLPDLYHSYLGLATLGLMGTEGIKDVDGAMCIGKEASDRLPALWKYFEQ